MARKRSLTHNDLYVISHGERTESLYNAKKEAKKIAKGLFYNDYVIDAISNAKTEPEITRIMAKARKSNMTNKPSKA